MIQLKLKDRIDYLLQEWVNHNSFHQNYPGVKRVLGWIGEELKAQNIEPEWIQHEGKSEIPPILKGTLPATTGATAPKVTLVCHADTVFPPNSPFQLITWTRDRNRAIGPGVIDDKGGILVILLALEKLSQLSERPFAVQMICMPGEEIGSPGFHSFLKKTSAASALILGFEPSLEDGSIIHSRRGNRWYEVKMTGPGGHAGRDAGKINNPVTDLAEKIATLSKLTDLHLGVSVSPGSITSNTTGFNVIPSEAVARIDVRYDSNEAGEVLHQKILPLLEGTEWELVEDCPALPLNSESEKLGKIAVKIIEKIERRKITAQKASGSSDCNYLGRPGVPILDGLGAVGSGIHSHKETIEMKSIFTRADVTVELIKDFFEAEKN